MSELKAMTILNVQQMGCYDNALVYFKSEADKVITELKNEIEVQKRLRNMALASVPNVLKVMKIIQHHKYKRCLDKAKMCESEENRIEAISPIFDTDKEYWEYNSDYWAKWHDCWLKLAEKFKPNN